MALPSFVYVRLGKAHINPAFSRCSATSLQPVGGPPGSARRIRPVQRLPSFLCPEGLSLAGYIFGIAFPTWSRCAAVMYREPRHILAFFIASSAQSVMTSGDMLEPCARLPKD